MHIVIYTEYNVLVWYDNDNWYDIWYDIIWYMIYDIWYMIYDIWYMIYDMIWYDMIWYDMIWYDIYIIFRVLDGLGQKPSGLGHWKAWSERVQEDEEDSLQKIRQRWWRGRARRWEWSRRLSPRGYGRRGRRGPETVKLHVPSWLSCSRLRVAVGGTSRPVECRRSGWGATEPIAPTTAPSPAVPIPRATLKWTGAHWAKNSRLCL